MAALLSTQLTLPEEQRLVTAAQAGDLDAFERLAQAHERRIYRMLLHMLGNPADAEDALQEAFLKAYAKLKQFHGDSRFYTWLVRISVNEGLMLLRKKRGTLISLDQELEGSEEPIHLEVPDWRPNPEQQYARSELRQILETVLQSLALPYRLVFQLRDMEELSTEETAETLHITPGAVKTRLFRARMQLREKLSQYFASIHSGTTSGGMTPAMGGSSRAL